MDSLSIGISVADYNAARGHVDPTVYARADHLEYGGLTPPREDAGFALAYRERPVPVGRHLVTTELVRPLDVASEARGIAEDLAPFPMAYALTDAELWRWGTPPRLWARPVSLDRRLAARVAANARALSTELGIPVLVENPAFLEVPGELGVVGFLSAVAEEGGDLCLDLGHFYAAVLNAGADLDEAWERLPFRAVRVAHLAGLSTVRYQERMFLVDNHDVLPHPACLGLLRALVGRAPQLRWLTYEAELASTAVQLAGLAAIRRALSPGAA